MSDTVEDLRLRMSALEPGVITGNDADQVIEALRMCWADLVGAHETAMASHKLERAEDLRWAPPVLTFRLERHGGTVQGSTRAEIQRWEIDTGAGTARSEPAGYRQLIPAAKRWNPEPVAETIAAAILEGRSEPFLTWKSDHSAVRVLTTEVIPDPHGPKQTFTGRSKRLHAALAAHLDPHGWRRNGQWWRHTDGP